MIYRDTDFSYHRREKKLLPWLYPLWLGVMAIMIGATIIFFPRILVWLLSTMLFVLGATLIMFAFYLRKNMHVRSSSRLHVYDFYV
ncbi:MAG: hypothetical protein K8S27_03205 [Candidatus Omnitrophica bacterium]|nr:hypothetical protein [Candidatus Omnitrophota bacterium]